MYRILLCAITALLAGAAVMPRAEQLSIYAGVGYGFGIGGLSSIPGELIVPIQEDFRSVERDGNGDVVQTDDNYLNYGSGFKLDLGVNYAVMENVAVQAGIAYSASAPAMQVYNTTPGTERTDSYKRHTLGIKVLAIPSFRVVELIDVHVGAGIGVYFAGVDIERESTNPNETVYRGELKSRPAFGFCGQLGADYPLTDIVTLVADLNFEAHRFTLEYYRPTWVNTTVHYQRNAIADNEYTPPKVPGTNWALRVGVKFAVL